jgi:iron complex outermembrane recepter protein
VPPQSTFAASARTLVLVDGHRLTPGDPRFPVADINSIPTSIIERVEVLTGGAAAVYGSDAVAGVVNFILQTKVDGLKIEGEVSGYQHLNGDRFVQGLLDQHQIPYPSGSVFDGARQNVSVAFRYSVRAIISGLVDASSNALIDPLASTLIVTEIGSKHRVR